MKAVVAVAAATSILAVAGCGRGNASAPPPHTYDARPDIVLGAIQVHSGKGWGQAAVVRRGQLVRVSLSYRGSRRGWRRSSAKASIQPELGHGRRAHLGRPTLVLRMHRLGAWNHLVHYLVQFRIPKINPTGRDLMVLEVGRRPPANLHLPFRVRR